MSLSNTWRLIEMDFNKWVVLQPVCFFWGQSDEKRDYMGGVCGYICIYIVLAGTLLHRSVLQHQCRAVAVQQNIISYERAENAVKNHI